MKRLSVALVAACLLSACGSSSPAPTPTPVPSTPTPQPAPTSPTSPAPPTATTFTVSGTVTDGTSHGILPNIGLTLTDSAGAGRSVRTDAGGAFAIDGVPSGAATLVTSAVSYQTVTQQFSVTGNTHIDVVLPRVPSAPPAPTIANYQGQWLGDIVVITCQATGTVLTVINPCVNGFPPGQIHPLELRIIQSGSAVSGQLIFGSEVGSLQGTVASNGHLTFSGQVTTIGGGITFVDTVSGGDLVANGTSATGGYSRTGTISGLTGGYTTTEAIRTLARQ